MVGGSSCNDIILEKCSAGAKKIALTQGMHALVDDADFEWLSQYKWHASCSKDTFRKTLKWYAVRFETIRFKTRPSKRKKIYMHREILGFPRGKVVDHNDGDGLNNRRGNLKTATYYQNAQNRNKRPPDEPDVFDEAIAAATFED